MKDITQFFKLCVTLTEPSIEVLESYFKFHFIYDIKDTTSEICSDFFSPIIGITLLRLPPEKMIKAIILCVAYLIKLQGILYVASH